MNKKSTKALCAEHKLPIQFLNVEDSNPTLFCRICKMKNKNLSSEPLSIQDEILDLSENQIMGEWPFNDFELIAQIQQTFSDEQTSSLNQEAKQFFKWIIATIIEIIDTTKSNYEKQATQVGKYSESIIEKYNQGTQKQQLQNLFSNISQDNLAQISEEAKKIISQVNSNSEICKSELQMMLEQRQKIIKTLNDPSQIKYETYELLIQWIKQQQSQLPQMSQNAEQERIAQEIIERESKETIEKLKTQIEEIQQRNAAEEKRIKDSFTIQIKKLQDEIEALNKSLQEKEKEIKDQQTRMAQINQKAETFVNHKGCGRMCWNRNTEKWETEVKCSNSSCSLCCGDQCLACRHRGREGTLLCYKEDPSKTPLTCEFNAGMSAEWKKIE